MSETESMARSNDTECSSCGKEYTARSSVVRHMRRCCPKRLVECPTCGTGYSSDKSMKQHHARMHDESIAGELIECDVCGGTKRKTPSRIERSERDFCSPECRHKAQEEYFSGAGNPAHDGGHYKECENCGEDFWVSPSTEHYRFCGPDCAIEGQDHPTGEDHHNYNTVETSCEHCGAELERIEWRIENYDHQFCDEDCYGEWSSENIRGGDHPLYEGGSQEYGPGWANARQDALERDNHECQRCGIHGSDLDRSLDVHHITPVKEFETHEDAHNLKNLVSLCRPCHRKCEKWNLRPDTR